MSFALLLHSHQPVGNFDHVIEEAYRKAYLPFLEVLTEHPQVRLGLHYSGHLLEWIETRHPEFFSQLGRLVERRQVELVGGGYYEPILPAIPDGDKLAQLRKLSEYLSSRFGVTPRGAWLAERVWEPSLARPLAEAGVEYIVLDDTHFLAAGLGPDELRGYYLTEEAGFTLRLVPSLKALRYAIPFREPAETLDVLRRGLEGTGPSAPLFAMGDDSEKFGVWPETFEHCYQKRWLERFLAALEQAKEWLETTTLSDYLGAHEALGRIYLPTASYEEMMLWALPLAASQDFKACLAESGNLPSGERFRRFLHGGFWRNFLAKYPESNQTHKLMLDVSRRLEAVRKAGVASELAPVLAEAETHLLASQCNDAYWHGVFGGLYAPHLRAGIQRRLIQAESLLDRLEARGPGPSTCTRHTDFDADGQEEIMVEHPLFGLVLRPDDGGTLSSLRFKPADAELVNALRRREESYHTKVRQAASAAPGSDQPASIHERVKSKEPNLAAYLLYDNYPRHVFRTYVFPASKLWQDFESLRLEESAELAGGGWTVDPAGVRERGGEHQSFTLTRAGALRFGGVQARLAALKTIATEVSGSIWRLECRSHFTVVGQGVGAPPAFGLEIVFNLLAPEAPNRYFLASGAEGARLERLGFRGELAGSKLLMVDEWQRVRLSLRSEPEPAWWIAPIETVSQSEAGFERVYQGSAILAVWKPALKPALAGKPAGVFESRIAIEIEPWGPMSEPAGQ